MSTDTNVSESLWIGHRVRQSSGIPNLIGRTGKVTEAFWDENGALHLKMVGAIEHSDDWWCPAQHLTRM